MSLTCGLSSTGDRSVPEKQCKQVLKFSIFGPRLAILQYQTLR